MVAVVTSEVATATRIEISGLNRMTMNSQKTAGTMTIPSTMPSNPAVFEARPRPMTSGIISVVDRIASEA
jgi:hypothetical protein